MIKHHILHVIHYYRMPVGMTHKINVEINIANITPLLLYMPLYFLQENTYLQFKNSCDILPCKIIKSKITAAIIHTKFVYQRHLYLP